MLLENLLLLSGSYPCKGKIKDDPDVITNYIGNSAYDSTTANRVIVPFLYTTLKFITLNFPTRNLGSKVHFGI